MTSWKYSHDKIRETGTLMGPNLVLHISKDSQLEWFSTFGRPGFSITGEDGKGVKLTLFQHQDVVNLDLEDQIDMSIGGLPDPDGFEKAVLEMKRHLLSGREMVAPEPPQEVKKFIETYLIKK